MLLDADIERVRKIDAKVGGYIARYRNQDFRIEEGGGGRYGRIIFENSGAEGKEENNKKRKRETLDNYF